MLNQFGPARPFQLQYLEASPPTGPLKRSKPRGVTVGFYPTHKAAGLALEAFEAAEGPQLGWRILKGTSKVYFWVDFHGPLGYLDKGWVKGISSHPNDCPRCVAIRARKSEWTVNMSWEAKEALGKSAPFCVRTAARYAAEGWKGPPL